MGKKNELVKVEPGTLPILQGESVAAALQANLGGLELTANDLERIKVPSSGSTMWTYETLEGECSEKQIVGVIIYHKLVRLYWAKKIDEGGSGQPPDCHCDNGINPVGVGSPGGKCVVCPHAQFGSAAKGGGQACQQRWALFMALPWSRIPVLLSAPPTSLAPIKRYMLRLSSNGVPYWSVLTTLALDVKQNAAGIKYASIVPSMVERIEGEARERFRKLNEELAPLFSTIAVEGPPVSNRLAKLRKGHRRMSKIITPSQQGMAMPVSQIDPLRMVSDHLDAIIAQGVPLGYDYARISEIHRRAHIIVQTILARSSVSWHLPVVKQIARMAGENIDDEAAAAKIRAALEQIAKDQAERNGE